MNRTYASELRRQVEYLRMGIRKPMVAHDYLEARSIALDILRIIDKLQELESTQSQEVAP